VPAAEAVSEADVDLGGAWLGRIVEGLRRWQRRHARPGEDAAIARGLAELGPSGADIGAARAGSEDDIRRMMAHFGIDPARVPPPYLAAVRDAERVCGQCLEAGRCHRFFAGPEGCDAARLFCPNAALFDRIAAELAREEQDPA